MGYCKIIEKLDLSNEAREEMQKADVRRIYKDITKDMTVFNKLKNFYGRFMTSDAALFDDVRDAMDTRKVMARFSDTRNRLNYIFRMLENKPELRDMYGTYLKGRKILAMLRTYDADQMISNSKDFKEFVKSNPGSTLFDFEQRWKKIVSEGEKNINLHNDLKEVHELHKEFVESKVGPLYLEHADIMEKVVGKFDNAMDVVDAIYSRLMLTGANKKMKEFYEKTTGLDVDVLLDSPEYIEMAAHHILDKWKHDLRLHKRLIQDNINKDVMDELSSSFKNIKVVDQKYITSLDNNHPLKRVFKEVTDRIMKDSDLVYLTSGELDINDGELIKSLKNAFEAKVIRSIMKENELFLNQGFRSYIRSRYDQFPNLNKVINGSGKTANVFELPAEMELYNKRTGNNFIFKSYDELDHKVNMDLIKELESEIKKEKYGNADNLMTDLANKFPNHSIVTASGTEIIFTGQKISDIKNNNQILGHIIDLSDPSLIVEDMAIMQSIQDNGEDALLSALSKGIVNVVPKDKVDKMNMYKKELYGTRGNSALKKFNKVFTMSTLFAPWRLPGYILGTQVWGNIGHSIVGMPSALRNWPSFIKELKNAALGDYHKIADPDQRAIIELLMNSEGSGMQKMVADDFKVFDDPNIMREIEKLQSENNVSKLNGFIDKMFRHSTKLTQLVELVSRGSMAYEILRKKYNDKTYVPSTSNKDRVEHLWGIDDHLAAVRLANDSHIDYSNMPASVRRISQFMPFMSFKVGSAMNAQRMIYNTYRSVADAIKGTGSWRDAATYMGRGALAMVYRAGLSATLWNAALLYLGVLSEDEKEQMNSYSSQSIFNEMFAGAGLKLDKAFFIPGTGVKSIDSFFRLNRGNQKMDPFMSAEALVPGLDSKWRDGKHDFMQTIGGNIASGFSPVFKTPLEASLGWGNIREDGYHKPNQHQTQTENILYKMLGFVGLNTFAESIADDARGNPDKAGDSSAFTTKQYMYAMRNAERADDTQWEMQKTIGNGVLNYRKDVVLEGIAKYRAELVATGKYTEGQINRKILRTLESNSLAHKIAENPALAKLNGVDQAKLLKAVKANKDFLDSLGFGVIH